MGGAATVKEKEMSNNNRIVEMTFEEFRQREQQTTKLAEELEAMRTQVEHLQTCLDREAAKSIRKWRKDETAI